MEVERITFERTGGFAGMHLTANFKPDDLPEEQAEALSELLDELDFNELPERMMNNPSLPDQFTYRITVETKQGEHTVVTGDISAPEELQELLQMLNGIARNQMRKQ
ncbi:MAG TPA: protealysin inhibitor emfourin [Anaerolineales bacterium]|nr:protealysin inhibitor emfourin [Anaerolineales bacterium]